MRAGWKDDLGSLGESKVIYGRRALCSLQRKLIQKK